MTATHYPPPPGTTTGISGTGFGPNETPEFLDAQSTTTPGSSQTLITRVVGATESYFISSVVVTCRKHGCFELREDAAVIGSGRTGGSQTTTQIIYTVAREVPAGKTLTLVFEQPTGAGSASDIEAYVIGYRTT